MSKELLILAMDTATRLASVALCRGADVLSEQTREVTTHSEGLLATIQDVLGQGGVTVAELNGIACGRGPGSFTGLRIGMATAKGLCFAADKPLVCPSSLYPLAAETDITVGRADRPVLAVLDARRKEVFCALYRGGQELATPWVCRPEDLADHLPPDRDGLLLAGDGALLYQEQLLADLGPGVSLAPENCHTVQARHLGRAAAARLEDKGPDNLHTTVPHYIRASDARLPKIVQL